MFCVCQCDVSHCAGVCLYLCAYVAFYLYTTSLSTVAFLLFIPYNIYIYIYIYVCVCVCVCVCVTFNKFPDFLYRHLKLS